MKLTPEVSLLVQEEVDGQYLGRITWDEGGPGFTPYGGERGMLSPAEISIVHEAFKLCPTRAAFDRLTTPARLERVK